MKRSTIIALGSMAAALGGGFALLTRKTEGSLRQAVVDAALGEKNAPNPVKYWNDVLVDPSSKPKEWCGALLLWAIHKAGLGRDIHWVPGLGFLEGVLPRTSAPKPGDVAYFTKNQHQALVKSVNSNGTITVINGNDVGGSITVKDTPRSNVAAFYSIQPLVQKAIG
jgi:hypothetical protein